MPKPEPARTAVDAAPESDATIDDHRDVAVTGRVPVDGHRGVVVRFTRRGGTTELEVAGPPVADVAAGAHPGTGAPIGADLVSAIAGAIAQTRRRAQLAGSSFHLAADHPADSLRPLPEAVATAAGLPHRRDLLQLRRTLPVPDDHPARAAAPPLTTRPFRPGPDDAAWIRINNRAFAAHPDQGAESRATLAARIAEGWFDADGFLVADDPGRDGELSGFCWTKVHPATDADPSIGEIYVIGVDPSHRREGLGPAFVLAGLDHLASAGIGTANLYVDAGNAPARRLYDRLGFATHAVRRVYS